MSMLTDRRVHRTDLSCKGTTRMSHRSRQVGLVIAALVVAACAPHRPAPGALAPVSARSTNEMRIADLAVLDAWEQRRVALLRNDGDDLSARAIALARAGAWLVFAREAYLGQPHSRNADDALAEARTLMAPYERADDAPTTRSALATSADRVSPDNWAEIERLASTPGAVGDVASLAEAEIELVRAAAPPVRPRAPAVMLAGSSREPIRSAVVLPTTVSETSVSPLSCPAVQHIARAIALIGEADVLQQGQARQLAKIESLKQDERVRARSLHFALASDMVGMPSAAMLSGVAGALRAHPELQLVIEGHADPRGGTDDNRTLSGRRATMVRDILADSGVTDDRMLVRQFGARRRAAAGTTVIDYARDRRVQLKFLFPDGEELPITDDSAVDLQIERVVKRSAALRRRPGTRRIVKAPR